MNDEDLIKIVTVNIINYVLNDHKICKYFNGYYKSQKYTLNQLLPIIIFVLKQNISWRSVSKLKICGDIHWNTVYKMHIKLVKYKVYENTYVHILNKFYNKQKNANNLKVQMTDTTNIFNKGGIDKIGYNRSCPKHNISKLSIISDFNGVPLNMKLSSGNINDAKIFNKQLDSNNLVNITLENKNKSVILADKAYDSSILRQKILDKKYKRLIVPMNKRNIKNPKLIKKMTKRDKNVFNHRSVIERKINTIKRYKRINIRYDKYSSSYMGFVYLSCIMEIFK